ncbi:hypothetical protein NE237_000058 [Protea cynaroides]|uniref:Uncharacterized protein n=1 Tax=Protea cynaroides TaxID=273540 RepID=A0A9Q0GKL1_9MAGN|nr:hypothetical protein NE237_000058 [Protea cynaroides]
MSSTYFGFDPIYVSFHDEEWGVLVHDDQKLFEMLVLSKALTELSWPTILNRKDIFRIGSKDMPMLVSTWMQATQKKGGLIGIW